MARPIAELPSSSGVDALIARLREEGVTAGHSEAERIIGDAQSQANRILDKAQREARERLDAAHKEADAYRAAGKEALRTAMRDMVLDMKAALMEKFSSDVRRLVSHHLDDPNLMRQMILEVAGRARESAAAQEGDQIDILLPEKAVGVEELRRNPAELKKGRLTGLVFGLTGDMLRDGVTFSTSDEVQRGIRIHMVDKDITLDLTDQAVADFLLQHLQPRFRAVFEGVVK
jgi:V/A-type H+/Na+-transporting ATPase subunit E